MQQEGTSASAAEPTQQRRRRRRKTTALEVRVAPARTGRAVSTRLRDLSLEGMAIAPPGFALRLGQPVWAWFDAARPGPEHVIQARVVHVSAKVVGLWFQEMGVGTLEVLHQRLGEAKYF